MDKRKMGFGGKRKMIYRLISIFLGLVILYSFGFGTIAQDEPAADDAAAEGMMADALTIEMVQENVDAVQNSITFGFCWRAFWSSSCRPVSPCWKAA